MKSSVVFKILKISLVILVIASSVFIQEVFIGSNISTIIFVALSLVLSFFICFKDKEFRYPVTFTKLLLLFLYWAIIATFFSTNLMVSIWEILRYLGYFMLFISVYNLGLDKKIRNLIIILFSILGFIVVAFDLYNFYGNSGTFSGSLSWHNQMAAFLLFLIPCLLTLFLYAKNQKIKLLLFIVNCVSLLGLIYTGSRGGWISVILSLLIFIILRIQIIKKQWKYFVVIGLVVFVSTIFSGHGKYTVSQVTSVTQETDSQTRDVSGNLRLSILENALKMMRDYPIFGGGFGEYGMIGHTYQNKPYLYSTYAHNYFLQIGAELGVPGLLIISMIMIYILYMMINEGRLIYKKKIKDPFVACIIVVLLGSMIHSSIDYDWSRVALYSLFWIFLALFFAAIDSNNKKTFEIKGLNKSIYILYVIIFVIVITLLLSEKLLNLAKVNLGRNNLTDAQQNISKAILLNRFDDRFYFTQGQIFEAKKDINQAELAFKQAIKLSPSNGYYYYSLGSVELRSKNTQKAKALFLKAIQLGPYSEPLFYLGLTDVYILQKQMNEAEKVLIHAQKDIFPLNDGFFGFKYLYDFTGYTSKIETMYIKFILIKVQLHKKADARQLLTILEQLNPKNPTIPFFKKITQE